MNRKDFKNKSEMQIFLSYFKPHRKLFFLDMVCALCICVVDLLFPVISRYAMQTLLPGQLFGAFFAVMGALAVAYLLKGGFYYIVTYWGHLLGVRMEADIRRDLFSHMQDLSFSFYDKNRTGQLMSRVTGDLFEITELAHHGPEDLFISFVTIVGALTVMATIEWRLTLVVAVMIPVFILIFIFSYIPLYGIVIAFQDYVPGPFPGGGCEMGGPGAFYRLHPGRIFWKADPQHAGAQRPEPAVWFYRPHPVCPAYGPDRRAAL